MPAVDVELARDLERPGAVERERRLDAALVPATSGNLAVRQPHRGDDLVDDDQRDRPVVRAPQLEPITVVGLLPRGDHPTVVAEQGHTRPALVAFDSEFKHEAAG